MNERETLLLALVLGCAERGAAPLCVAAGVGVEVFEHSQLVAQAGEQRELARGQGIACEAPPAERVLARLASVLGDFPRERLRQPLRVHLDPELPAGDAPLGAIEVHVTSRELLLARDALDRLEPEAFRHELLHTLAGPAPRASGVARRVWLTLEEGLTVFLARELGHAHAAEPALTRALEPPPLWEQLALPVYDPHELASSWAEQLSRSEPKLSLAQGLDCLTGSSEAAALEPRTFRQSLLRFTGRCGPDGRPVFQRALARWLPEPLSPWSAPEAAAPDTLDPATPY